MLKKHTICFKHAFDGLVLAFKTQPNYKIHFTLSIVALFLSWFLRISYFELLLVIFIIIIGIVMETINTAIEEATDAIDIKIREDLKIAKDTSAAAMLLYSIGALIIAIIIFVPKFINLFF